MVVKRVLYGVMLAALAILTSCGGEKKTQKQLSVSVVLDSLFKKGNDIRAFDFGMAREEFNLGDDTTVLENEKDLIVELIPSGTDDSVFAECSYRFENDLFQSCEVNIFAPNDSLNKLAFDSIQKVCTKRYGTPIEARGFYTWRIKSKKGYDIDIFLGDMTHELGSPAMQLQMHASLIEKARMAAVSQRNKFLTKSTTSF